MKKYFLSFAMTLLLALAIVPAAFADDTSGLQNLIDNATGNEITLQQDYNLTDTVNVNKAITINGNGHSVTAPADTIALKVTASGVTIDGLTVNTSSTSTAQQYNGYAIQCTASDLTVQNCQLNSYTRGIDFVPTNGNGATLNVSNTVIKNAGITDYDTNVNYGYDCRGIATADVKAGNVTITGGEILGFRYSLNPIITPAQSNLRDGNGTTFTVTGTTIKGWTALNMWSANSTYKFVDCNLVGINKQSGATNHYSVIMVNNGIYGNQENKESTVIFEGGSITGVKYGECDETIFNVDNEYKTNLVFTEDEDEEPVRINCYSVDNVAGVYPYVANVWNFYYLDALLDPEVAAAKVEKYMNEHVTGYDDYTIIIAGTLADYSGTLATNTVAMVEPEIAWISSEEHTGGDI